MTDIGINEKRQFMQGIVGAGDNNVLDKIIKEIWVLLLYRAQAFDDMVCIRGKKVFVEPADGVPKAEHARLHQVRDIDMGG